MWETRHNLNGSCDRPTKHTRVVFGWGHLTVRSQGLVDITVKKTYCLRPLDINEIFLESVAMALSDYVSIS